MSYGGRAQLQSQALEPQDCSSPPQNPFDPADQCACDGLTLQSCLSVYHPPRGGIGGPGSDFNGCFALCESDDDCSAPHACVKNLYGLDVCAPACRTSADCVAETCGVCQPGSYSGHGANYDDPSTSYCWYPGPCDATSCEGCTDGGAGWHQCSVQSR